MILLLGVTEIVSSFRYIDTSIPVFHRKSRTDFVAIIL